MNDFDFESDPAPRRTYKPHSPMKQGIAFGFGFSIGQAVFSLIAFFIMFAIILALPYLWLSAR